MTAQTAWFPHFHFTNAKVGAKRSHYYGLRLKYNAIKISKLKEKVVLVPFQGHPSMNDVSFWQRSVVSRNLMEREGPLA